MRQSINVILFVLTAALLGGCNASTTQLSKEINYADPTIFVENGKYYMTGTRNCEPNGFAILQSTDLKSWTTSKRDTLQLILRNGDHTFGDRGFWAPQILNEDGLYYLTYTANEQCVLASSDNLMGLYTQPEIKPIDGTERNIDSFIFKDDDGKYYLYHVRFNKGNYLWVAEFDLTKGEMKRETLTKCFDITEPWEQTPNYKSAPVMEGPTVIRIEDTYYLFYSANHFMNIDYAVGYATSKSPYGPWDKSPNSPIIDRSIVGENGSGHGDIFKDRNGDYFYVYHVHNSDTVVQPRHTRIVPLVFKRNDENGLFTITADGTRVIKPQHIYDEQK